MSKLIIRVLSLLGLISACVGQGVLQSGTCDVNINVVTNFDINAYLGVWYDIESLPSTFQGGTCNTATYALNTNGSISVQNTQVSNSLLAIASGTATAQTGVAAGTAKFDVLIGSSAVVPVPYWVLDTDYTTFALVYSCINEGTNQRRVNSWKLGRNKGALPASATTRINNIVSNVPALSQASLDWIVRNHTAEACSYFVDFDGVCPTVTGVANFDLNRYLGTWYEVARYPQNAQSGQCNRNVFTQAAGVVNVQNSQVTNQALGTISGTATTTTQSGVIAVTFNIGGVPTVQNLVVLATDYENYSLLYSCVDLGGNRRRIGSWQLRKNFNELSAAATTAIDTAINNTPDLQVVYYQQTSQTDAACFYYPNVEDLPDYIDLPGSCDTTITGVANFDVNRFLGTWYEVARYPQSAQSGQCNRAEYTQGTGVVNVQNSQVTNQALGTISGTATTTAQSGVLAVTLIVGGEPRTQNLHVLATDYDNYALLYNCVNIEGNRRRVGSWKMRRNFETLTEAANNAINTAIANTEGLREDYYRDTNQTDAACFYYPVFEQLPDVIELPGPCDTSITGVPNFDVTRYLGTWLEVAKYPQRTQTGECSRAQYTQGTGAVSVLNSQVINEALLTISGQATTTAQSGVLAVTLNVGGVPITTNLHVLATDYDSYSLAYSCTNVEGNRRQVASWQLRRNLNPLTEAATNALNNTIVNTEGLRAEYYQETSQTADACWHYLPQTGEKVIMPGQCDAQISGVSNINTTRFADNIWYQINRYDAVGERSCIGTKLTVDGSYINLNHIEVIGEEAKTIEGVARLNDCATGKFDLEMADSDEKEEIYILATDYDNYAIAYSCKNETTETRQIGAWQLSRTRSWPAAGNDALQRLIAERQEITDVATYFKAVPHNDECPEPSSAFLFRSSIIVIFVCTVLHLVW